MNEYDSIINDYVEAPASQAATSTNDNPDQAVRARQLSRATNQPVPLATVAVKVHPVRFVISLVPL